jgi:peptide/nickel transport system substrate-binding protein
MKRREFLRSMTALAAGSALPMPAIVPARAQSRQETLLIVSESGPNNHQCPGLRSVLELLRPPHQP